MIGRLEGSPGMLIEPASEHLAIFRPFIKRICGGVNADEALAVFPNERKQRGLLLVIERKFAGRVEDHRIEEIQVLRVAFKLLLRDQLRVRADVGVP